MGPQLQHGQFQLHYKRQYNSQIKLDSDIITVNFSLVVRYFFLSLKPELPEQEVGLELRDC